jgi:hypothetical protein
MATVRVTEKQPMISNIWVAKISLPTVRVSVMRIGVGMRIGPVTVSQAIKLPSHKPVPPSSDDDSAAGGIAVLVILAIVGAIVFWRVALVLFALALLICLIVALCQIPRLRRERRDAV